MLNVGTLIFRQNWVEESKNDRDRVCIPFKIFKSLLKVQVSSMEFYEDQHFFIIYIKNIALLYAPWMLEYSPVVPLFI